MPASTSDVAFTPPTSERHEGEQRGPAPPAAPHGQHGAGDEPGERGPRQQDHRDPGRVVEHVGRQEVGEPGDDGTPAAPAERAAQEQHAGSRREQDRAEPQALGEPIGHAEPVHHPVVGAEGEQVPDGLMGDGAEADRRVPHRHGPAEQPPGVEREVGLGVGAHLPDGVPQQWHVGHRGQRGVGPAARPRAAGAGRRRRGEGRDRGRQDAERRRRAASEASTVSVPAAVASQVNVAAWAAAPVGEASPQVAVAQHPHQRAGQFPRRGEQAGHARHDGVPVAPDVGDDGRRGARRRLGDRHAPALGHRRARSPPRPSGTGRRARRR